MYFDDRGYIERLFKWIKIIFKLGIVPICSNYIF